MGYLPGWGTVSLPKKVQNAGENWGNVNMSPASTTSLSCFHLSAMRLWLYLKKDSPFWWFSCSQLSDTAFKTLAALSWESFETPIVFSSMNLVIFFATSLSFTRAHLQRIMRRRLLRNLFMWSTRYQCYFDKILSTCYFIWYHRVKILLWTYPMRIPAWPVLFEAVKSVRSWSDGEDIGVYCGQ